MTLTELTERASQARRGRPKGSRNKLHKPETRTWSLRGEPATLVNIQALVAEGCLLSAMGLESCYAAAVED